MRQKDGGKGKNGVEEERRACRACVRGVLPVCEDLERDRTLIILSLQQSHGGNEENGVWSSRDEPAGPALVVCFRSGRLHRPRTLVMYPADSKVRDGKRDPSED